MRSEAHDRIMNWRGDVTIVRAIHGQKIYVTGKLEAVRVKRVLVGWRLIRAGRKVAQLGMCDELEVGEPLKGQPLTLNTLTGFTLVNGYSTVNDGQPGNTTSSAFGGGALGGRLENCVIQNCVSEGLNPANQSNAGFGGGIAYCVANRCIIKSNTVNASGGGGYMSAVCNSLIESNRIVNATSSSFGTGLNSGNNSRGNTFVRNGAFNSAGLPYARSVGRSTLYDIAWNNNASDDLKDSPQFVDYENGDYRLGPGSPCINAVKNAPDIGSLDWAGNPRVQLDKMDLGAYEASAQDILPNLTLAKVLYTQPASQPAARFGTDAKIAAIESCPVTITLNGLTFTGHLDLPHHTVILDQKLSDAWAGTRTSMTVNLDATLKRSGPVDIMGGAKPALNLTINAFDLVENGEQSLLRLTVSGCNNEDCHYTLLGSEDLTAGFIPHPGAAVQKKSDELQDGLQEFWIPRPDASAHFFRASADEIIYQ